VSLKAQLRTHVGDFIAVETEARIWLGTLLSYTARSVWIIDDDRDVVIPVPDIRAVHAA